MIEELIGKRIILFRNDGFKFEGKILEVDETHLKMIDIVVGLRYFLKSNIAEIKKVD